MAPTSTVPRTFTVIVAAASSSLGIGKQNRLPWRLSGDMAHFKEVTSTTKSEAKRNAVIMGLATWESIPPKFRPLSSRLNIVLSRQPESVLRAAPAADAAAADAAAPQQCVPDDVLICGSLPEALALLGPGGAHADGIEEVFVIGGAQVYDEALASPACERVHLTLVDDDAGARFADCDTFLPRAPLDVRGGSPDCPFELASETAPQSEKGTSFRFQVLQRRGGATAAGSGGTRALSDISNSAKGEPGAAGGKEAKVKPTAAAAAGGAADAAGDAGASASTPPPSAAESEASASGAAAAPADADAPHEEQQYLDLIRELLSSGNCRGDRTGTGTLSKFGVQMRFSLRDGKIPLLTTKRVFWRGVVEELLWFVSGSTNANELAAKGIHIWDGNGSREFLDRLGLSHREEGDLGPVYGFQWRHFGAEYADCHADYTGKGVDQLANAINTIKNNPNDRRIVVSAWNPSDLGIMALPPCHMFMQFYVANGELSCQMYQRSADVGLGVPFNIASYALLTRMVAHVCGLEAGDFIHVLGDAHVYMNHVEPLREQLEREPRAFPTLTINPEKRDIDSFTLDDFKLDGYKPHGTIKMKMAV